MTATIEPLYRRPGWHRFGYLGARLDYGVLDARVRIADAYVVWRLGRGTRRLTRFTDSRLGYWWGTDALTVGIRAANARWGRPRA